jgi:hypothetical protein
MPLGVDELPFATLGLPAAPNGAYPVAAASAWGDFGAATKGSHWLRADPVHLLTTRDGLFLVDGIDCPCSGEEAARLIAGILAAAPPPTGATLLCGPSPLRWYLRCEAPPRIHTVPISWILDQPVARCLPEGEAADAWVRWGNEVQMVLHAASENAEREAAGQLVINSLWLWGEGALAAPELRPSEQVFGAGPVVRGLAGAAGRAPCVPPVDAAAWMARAEAGAGIGHSWIFLEGAWAPACAQDAAAWGAVLEEMEALWFAPLLAGLRSGRIGRLEIATEGHIFTLKRHSLLTALWRKPHPVGHYQTMRSSLPPPPGDSL